MFASLARRPLMATGTRSVHTAPTKYFNKILIANRGEIACRVIRTAKRLGIKTVAVYSEPDEFAKHVRMADEAVCVGPAKSSLSYLNVEAIMDAIRKTGAEAVHPGYGFLSENAKFADRLEHEGIVFIGPPSSAIIAMGDKIESKILAKSAGVNVIPGYNGVVESPEQVLQIAHEIGYPVMIKASAGGGGKGMRIAWNDEEALSGFRLSKEEARNSFGDDRMFIEKYVNKPRHIEIQIIADGKGNVVYLPERECSIQRRNQKVVEEAPSTYLDPETRRAMGEQAAALARAVNYRAAGTVEMLVDDQKNFYFLEMNTRLQVEHPITEYITGLDLVEEMLRAASGHPLSVTQEQVQLKGWAMESRVYAEDPYRNFLPSIGTLKTYVEPGKGDPNVRVDSGVQQGSEISMFYDPMICKLVTYGPTRDVAIQRMRDSLDTYVIEGVAHNISFLRAVMENERFLKGDLTTNFIPEEFKGGFRGIHLSEQQMNALVASAGVIEFQRSVLTSQISGKLSTVPPVTARTYKIQVADKKGKHVDVVKNTTGFSVTVDSHRVNVASDFVFGDRIFKASVDGTPVTIQVERQPGKYILQYIGTEFPTTVDTAAEAAFKAHLPVKARVDTSKFLMSPMPGAVISVNVKAGDKVILGQELAVIEAMKMQNVLRADRDATVKTVKVKAGEVVAVEQVLVEFD